VKTKVKTSVKAQVNSEMKDQSSVYLEDTHITEEDSPDLENTIELQDTVSDLVVLTVSQAVPEVFTSDLDFLSLQLKKVVKAEMKDQS